MNGPGGPGSMFIRNNKNSKTNHLRSNSMFSSGEINIDWLLWASKKLELHQGKLSSKVSSELSLE